MSQITEFLNQLEAEAITTRKILSLVPTDKFEWKGHPKSMSLIKLATHIAEIPGWVGYAILMDELDVANPKFANPKLTSTEELLAFFEAKLNDGIAALNGADESTFGEKWLLKYGDHTLYTWTKAETIRHSISQIIHHRAQLGVYLRLLDIPIPGSYGPSADEMGG